MPDDHVSVRDAAAVLGVSMRRVRQLIEDDQLPAERVGNTWLVDRRAVENRARQAPGGGRPLGWERVWQAALAHELDRRRGAEADVSDPGGDGNLAERLDHVVRVDDLGDALLADRELRERLRVLLDELDLHDHLRAAHRASSARPGALPGEAAESGATGVWSSLAEDLLPSRAQRGATEDLMRVLDRPEWAKNRAGEIRRLRAHPGVLNELAEDDRLLLSGARAAERWGLDVVAGPEVDAYVLAADAADIRAEYALAEPADPRDVNVVLRLIERAPWDAPGAHHPGLAPRLLVALDLCASRDPRLRAAGERLVDQAVWLRRIADRDAPR